MTRTLRSRSFSLAALLLPASASALLANAGCGSPDTSPDAGGSSSVGATAGSASGGSAGSSATSAGSANGGANQGGAGGTSSSGGAKDEAGAAGEGGSAGDTPTLAPDPIPLDGTKVSVTIARTPVGPRLDSSFSGFSYEKGTINGKLLEATNTDLLGLYKLVGPGVLRIGANGVDTTTWMPNGKGGTAGQVAPSDVDRLAAFIKATGWKIIYAVNLGQSTPALAAAESKYAVSAFGDALLGLEIGNEPDIYHSTYKKPSYPYASFRTDWEAFASAIRAASANAPLTGDAAAFDYNGWTIPFAKDESSKISLLTQHRYVASGTDPASTIDKLLASAGPRTDAETEALAKAASANHVAGGMRYDETNSYFSGGASGVSNAYGSALWVIDYLFMLAQNGATGANFHGGGDGTGYTPIADNNGVIVEARPEYYGILLFTQAARGTLQATTATLPKGSTLAFSSWAVVEADGSTNVVLVNKDRTTKALVDVDVGRAVTSAERLNLAAPAAESTSGVTLGDVPIGKDGTWTPTEYAVALSGTHLTAAVPPLGATLIHVH